jgi:hypothetical protein
MVNFKEIILSPLPKQIKIPFLLGIKKILNDDLFISSYPKSGNTWLRIIIANILYPNENIHLNNIDNFIHGIEVAKNKINNKKEKRIIKSHYPYLYLYPKTIYIYRDYRDVLVSYYYYQKSLSLFTGSFSSFIRSRKYTDSPYKSWVEHIQIALNNKEKNPNNILILSYENLHSEIELSIKKITTFLDLPNSHNLNKVIDKSSFENLNNLESEFGSQFKASSNLPFFRKGIVNDWENMFEKEDLNWLYQQTEIKEMLTKLHYKI